MALKTYDPNQVAVVFAGVPIKGYADGTFITVTHTSTVFETVAGADGEVVRTKVGDQRAQVTLSLLQSSDSNDVLSALLILDENAPNGAGVGIFSMTDLSGRSLVVGAESWIVGWPEQTFDKTATQRDWVIEIANSQPLVGGN
jgi:hypothetical protein